MCPALLSNAAHRTRLGNGKRAATLADLAASAVSVRIQSMPARTVPIELEKTRLVGAANRLYAKQEAGPDCMQVPERRLSAMNETFARCKH